MCVCLLCGFCVQDERAVVESLAAPGLWCVVGVRSIQITSTWSFLKEPSLDFIPIHTCVDVDAASQSQSCRPQPIVPKYLLNIYSISDVRCVFRFHMRVCGCVHIVKVRPSV